MHRCQIEATRLLSDSILLNKEECRHLKSVLRARPADRIELFDGAGHTRSAVIESVKKNSIVIKPTANAVKHPRQKCSIALFACVSKGKRMDWSVEKAAELGTSAVIPVISDRTIVRLSTAERKSKVKRWQRVAADALRQCGGAWMPEIRMPIDFPDALKLIPDYGPVFTAALSDDAVTMREALAKIDEAPERAGWFVGPEGDFTLAELEQLRRAGAQLVSLGTNVLRTETAAVYGLCVLECAWQ